MSAVMLDVISDVKSDVMSDAMSNVTLDVMLDVMSGVINHILFHVRCHVEFHEAFVQSLGTLQHICKIDKLVEVCRCDDNSSKAGVPVATTWRKAAQQLIILKAIQRYTY